MSGEEICGLTVDQYIARLIEFHGNMAPGLLVGGFMVDAGVRRMTEYEYFDVISETTSCLPDAVQLLTPCTVGNGWLKIVPTGRFALALYDKNSGHGVRVSLDLSKLERYPEIAKWFLRRVSKHEQDKEALIQEIRAAGHDILAIRPVVVSPTLWVKQAPPPVAVCSSCGEAYPGDGGTLCPACRGMDLYL